MLLASYRQVYNPVSSSLGLSALLAMLPLLTLFVLLGGLRMKAWMASLIALVVALVIAVAVYSMPVGERPSASSRSCGSSSMRSGSTT